MGVSNRKLGKPKDMAKMDKLRMMSWRPIYHTSTERRNPGKVKAWAQDIIRRADANRVAKKGL